MTKLTCSSDFIQYRRGNDWGHVYYADSFTGARLSVKIGQAVRVRFPDKHERTLLVEAKPYQETVSDHGHAYTANSNLLGFTVDYHGVKAWIPIETVETATVY